jgi:glucoamylase
VLDRPGYTTKRYVRHHQGQTALTVTSPADKSSVGDSITVTGTSLPGNAISVAATNTDSSFATVNRTTRAGTDGSFSVTIPLTGGTWVINTVATARSGATARDVRTVVFDFTPGTVVLDVTDPTGDDNGPGNYAYPTSPDFHPGAYDIQRFQVLDAGDRVTFRLQTRDLTNTFGSPLGAQLVDVFVHIPGAAPTSTAAPFDTRRYEIDPAGAWNKRLEVQGFGQQYVDASGATLGTIAITANPISRFITFSVPKASLGTPGPGWAFTVVLTGQDGFSSDQARGFQPTPQEFQFGVCAAASLDPHCTFNPGQVPKAVDVIGGQAQLDYTLGPVAIQPVQ